MTADPPTPSAGPFLLRLAGGAAFLALWLAAAAAWAAMSLTGAAMANDSGAVSADRHATFLLRLIAGEIVAACAGLPGGLAFIRARRRRLFVAIFATLFILGVGLQIWAFWSFASAAV